MAIDDIPISKQNRSIETLLTELLHTAQPPEGDLQGTYTLPAFGEDHPAYTVEITVPDTADERTHQHSDSYCLHCNWTVSTADYSRREVTRRMVDHAIETGHDIESTDKVSATATNGTDHPASEDISPATTGTERSVPSEEGQNGQKRT